MGWLRAVGSLLSRSLLAISLGRTPRFTLSAEAAWMARYGDSDAERRTGAWLQPRIDRLAWNGPGHCEAALRDHFAWMRGRLDRAAAIDAPGRP
jgi:hypothetical protein